MTCISGKGLQSFAKKCATLQNRLISTQFQKKETTHFCFVRQRTGLCTVYPLTGFNKTIKPILKTERALPNLNLNYEERIRKADSLKS